MLSAFISTSLGVLGKVPPPPPLLDWNKTRMTLDYSNIAAAQTECMTDDTMDFALLKLDDFITGPGVPITGTGCGTGGGTGALSITGSGSRISIDDVKLTSSLNCNKIHILAAIEKDAVVQ